MHAIPGIVNQVRVLHISSIFLYFHWDFDNRHYFYDKVTFTGFFKSSAFARLYLEVLVTLPQLKLKMNMENGRAISGQSSIFELNPILENDEVLRVGGTNNKPN